jgi:hypothetical protein
VSTSALGSPLRHRGKPNQARVKVQRAPAFIKPVKWRTGSENRISCLKRDFLWRRTLFDGQTGAQTWCGWGVLAHNSLKISKLAATAGDETAAGCRRRPARARPGSDPPTPTQDDRKTA